MEFQHVQTFEQWRDRARDLLANGVAPADVAWQTSNDQPSLFAGVSAPATETRPQVCAQRANPIAVPRRFIDLARHVGCHRDPSRWQILYRVLWRIVHEQPALLSIVTDEEIHKLLQMQKAVTRDMHKMKAFVRFRKIDDDPETFVAWHRPDHKIVSLVAPFFARRFKTMNWTILTPDKSATWDGSNLHYGPGVCADEAPQSDALEELWKTYYASTFNPARVKVAMMKREMPVRHWPTLPETQLIPELLRQAPSRVERMIGNAEGFETTAALFMPQELTLARLAEAAARCTACALCNKATQVVFGEGTADAKIVLVGEQPGDREDREGRPFIGPAGWLLSQCMVAAGVTRDRVYLTNTVKHFKFTERGKRRLHQKPDLREIFACRPWLEAELSVVRPSVVVCLGATAAGALLGRDYRINESRGRLVKTEWCDQTLSTWHPAAILRMPDPTRRQQMTDQLTSDLRTALESVVENA